MSFRSVFSFGSMAFAAAFACGVASATSAQAQASTDQCPVSKTDWTVCLSEGPKQCWATSSPKSVVNRRGGQVVDAKRSDILMFVVYQPGNNVQGQVAFTGGYPFAPGSTVEVKIGSKTFSMATDGEWAWPEEGKDGEIVTAMKRGADAVVTGRSARGTVTTDTFSLIGFTASVDEAADRCK